jgi:putative ABC transport system substrate-binding protein
MDNVQNIYHKRFYNLFVFICIFFVVSAALCPPAVAEQGTRKIAIVKSSEPAFDVALEGFLEVMNTADITYETATFNLRGQVKAKDEMMKEIRSFHPDMILTIGSRATSVISKRFEDIPIVFSMVLYPTASGFVSSMRKPGKNVTGAAMDVPIEHQFGKLLEIVPNLKRIGVLYNPDETLPIIEDAMRVTDSMNMQLLAEKVKSERDVPSALRRLEKQKMDALWSVVDGTVFTNPSIEYIGRYVLRKGIPFMGPFNSFVERGGALVALSALDYRDNGRQAGEISIQILHGTKPMNIPVASPRKIEMALSLRAANHIRLRIPQEIIDEASQVFD